MELNEVSTPIPPIQNGPIVQPQATSEPPENEPEVTVGEDGGGKANGVVSKLNEGGHFKGVADVRLRISHFDNAGLEKIDPDLLPDPEDVPGKGYEKFLEQYQALYIASQALTEPEEPAIAEEPVNEIPVPDPVPVIIEEPVVETLPVPEEPPVEEESVNEIPETDPVIVTPFEIEPVVAPEQTEPEAPVDEGEGILAAFEELWETQALEKEPETLDIVM